jgi:hypothetical protein
MTKDEVTRLLQSKSFKLRKRVAMTQRELISMTSRPTTARALVRVHPDNGSEPLVGWFKITRFPSSLSEAGFP